MSGRIITLGEWYDSPVGDNLKNIFSNNPIINMLFPEATLDWMNQQSPQISPHSIVFAEAIHKFKSRYVYHKYQGNIVEDLATVINIKDDITATSLTEWNKFKSMKEVINGDLSLDRIKEIFGNYSITKVGGWSDTYKSEDFSITDTWTRETKRTTKVSNFESTDKDLTETSIDYEPSGSESSPVNSTTHSKERVDNKPSTNRRVYDGGTDDTTQHNYKEFGMKNGEFYQNYYKFILSFPNAVDMFLNATATSYLLDIYNPSWLCE